MYATTGSVYIATAQTSPVAAYIQLDQQGTVKFKATKADFTDVSTVTGLNTTAVFG